MRGLKGVIKGIEKALPIFHQYGIYPDANLGINRNTGGLGKISMKMTDKEAFYGEFKEAFQFFYQFVMDLSFTMVNACYPMSMKATEGSQMKAVYGAESSNSIISFLIDEKAFCKACDWECFRDPSELIGFFIHSFKNPLSYKNKSLKHSAYIKLWKEDLKYYKMCDYFDGRKPMNNNREKF